MADQIADISIESISSVIAVDGIEAGLAALSATWPDGITFSTSFSLEDQVISHAIFSQCLPIAVFTLDTGRMFPETYSVWSRTIERYKVPIQAFYPDADVLEYFVSQHGPNSFYESVENRKQCCAIRKVDPLRRALKGMKLWITGIRSAHSPNRTDMKRIEWDETNRVFKYHPLLDWTDEQVRSYILKHGIPYNILHDRGFVSIGCAPCTRAIEPHEDFRAGRWWWEDEGKKECGLHNRGRE